MINIDLVSFQAISSKNIPATTSLKISEVFGKAHSDILYSIDEIILTGEFSPANFFKGEYKNRGKNYPMYYLDEMFTTVLLMGFTGKEAIKWKVAYAKEFQRMREEIKIIREKGDRYAICNDMLKEIADAKRLELEGKKGHIGYYVNLAKVTNELAFGYHEKDMRQNLNQEQGINLAKTLLDITKLITREGITNPTKIKNNLSSKKLK